MNKLLQIDAILADISVKGDDVNKMATVRKLLYEVFKEGENNGEQRD